MPRARFAFALAPVLAHRRGIETRHRAALAVALNEYAAAGNRLDELERRARSAQAFGLHRGFLESLNVARDAQAGMLAALGARADLARDEVLAAAAQTRALERLEARRRREHEARELRAEQEELDEVNR